MRKKVDTPRPRGSASAASRSWNGRLDQIIWLSRSACVTWPSSTSTRAVTRTRSHYTDARSAFLSRICRRSIFGTASILNNLARLYYRRARYTEAEPLYLRSLAILEKTLGSDHPAVAESLRNIADLYRAEGRAGEAEALDQRSVVIRRAAHGSSKTCNDCP